MRLTPDIALVGGGNFGFNISAPLDCHIYLIDGGDEIALVDAGMGGKHGATDQILANIEADGYDLSKIKTLLLTHYHTDHAGGSADFKRRLGVTVVGSPLCAHTLSIGDEETVSLPFAKKAGFYPTDYVYEACPAEGTLVDGKSFNIGRLKVTPFDTDGHSRGHVSFLVEGGDRKCMILGDLVFHAGTILAENIPDCSIQEYAASCIKMAKVEFDAFLPGHLSISLRDGKRHVDMAAAAFNQLLIPKNAI